MKPLAPYAEYLKSQVQAGIYEVAIIFMGSRAPIRALELCEIIPSTLYIPPYTSPSSYAWPVRGCDVWLVDTGYTKTGFVKYCAAILLSYGASVVHYVAAHNTYTFEKGISA